MSNSPLTNAVIVTLLLFFTTVTVGWVGSAQNPSVGEELIKLFEKEVAGQMDGTDPPTCALSSLLTTCRHASSSFSVAPRSGSSRSHHEPERDRDRCDHGARSKDHSGLLRCRAIVPHGIFEIPAFILSGALGILLAQSLIAEWYGNGDTAMDARPFGRLFLFYVLPLVAIAAFVEAFITPVVIHLVA